ncbi:MAG: bifunctional phosphoribosylaminoimidazolecarboxamide formyltransferase/IMP cyclohydrolase [Candidatus Aerophobetes bacterium]|nr:bifunctional phosphoribosylaminoimidazolecarboxamide formyltransferase/IMP cyclohydrolase [Candidatus Aerophobetes bacterium]
MPEIKRALISVYNKEGIVNFAKGLKDLGIEILSTGGTAKILRQAGISVKDISEYTGSPPMLGGRVKTLHPKIHGAILALRDNPEHMKEVKEYNIDLIDMVVVNLYPFRKVTQKKVNIREALENIDIGGPTMLRAAAKNYLYVAAVSSPPQYLKILKELKENNCSLSKDTSLKLATKVFQETSAYDSFIAQYLGGQKKEGFPEIINLSFKKVKDLRYGENSHQKGAFYEEWVKRGTSVSFAQKLSGKELSFNNLLDLNAALKIVKEFKEPACVVIKHTNPCGAGCGSNLFEAFRKAYAGDPLSAFGSIVGLNRVVDVLTAEEIASPGRFVEGIIAPDYEEKALEILKTRQKWGKNVRILRTGSFSAQEDENEWDIRRIGGGVLLQEEDRQNYDDLKVATRRKPTQEEQDDLLFAWAICKHVRSNAIVLTKDKMVVGVGAGQMSRVDSCFLAAHKAGDKAKGSVLASDAFFPFPDAVEEAGKEGVTAIIQPGGSLRDKKVIEAANKYNIAMIFTGMRHFKH